MLFTTSQLKQQAAALGFNLVGIIPAKPSPYLAAYLRWIEAGMHGSMGYMARPDRVERRRDLNVILPGVRSIVVVGLDYGAAIPDAILNDPARGRIASYAWGDDYHDMMTPRLEQLASGLGRSHRVYVDTGAILERSHAQAAGLGFVGKNTMLIHPRRGSLFFVGEILTDAEFDVYDQPFARATMCGSCTRCLHACPTDAFPAPHVLDARRCISYLTIEHKGWIDRSLRPLMGNWIYGCDVCQDVCPFQRFAPGTGEPALAPVDVRRAAPPLLDVLALDEAEFAARFGGSAIARIRRERLVRNACIAAGNWGAREGVPPLLRLVDDASPLVRGHAAWALGRIGGAGAALVARLESETDEMVRMELRHAIEAQPC
jgi:epoxyqueuosine reductase